MSFDLDRIGGDAGLKALVTEVITAGDEAKALFDRGLVTERKDDHSPVTEADRKTEERLRTYIASQYEDAAFFGEESGKRSGRSGLRFVVDPIDGTRAFVRGLPTWSVLVGVEFNEEPVVGIAYMPAAEDCFVGVDGAGATHNDQKVRVSSVKTLKEALVCHGALQQFTEEGLGKTLESLANATDSARGLADFDGYRQVLLGRADAMVDPGVKPYDICAAAVLIREAGGRFTSLDGNNTVYGPGGLASNGAIHDALLHLLANASS